MAAHPLVAAAAAFAWLGCLTAAQSSTPTTPLPLFWATSGTDVINLERCGYHPFIDYGIRLLPTDGTATGPGIALATASIVSGGSPNDTLLIDPDPFRLCAPPFSLNCTLPCGPTIAVEPAGTGVALTPLTGGSMSASDVTSCMRRLFLGSIAFGGEEGVGTHVISYTAITTTGVSVSSVVPNRVTYVDPPSDEACGRFTSSRVFVTAGPPGVATYYTGCPFPFLCRTQYALVYPNATVTIPEPWASSGDPFSTFVQRVELTFRPFSRIGLPPYDPATDRLWVLPDPALGPPSAATCETPCPGITILPTVSATATDPGAFIGITLYGPASPEAFTSCLRRVYYFNTAVGSGTVPLLGPRPVGITAVSPVRSSITTSSGIARFDAVNVTGGCPVGPPITPPGLTTVCGTPGPDSRPCCPFPLAPGCLAPEYIVRGGLIIFPPGLPVATPLVTIVPTAGPGVLPSGVVLPSELPSGGPGGLPSGTAAPPGILPVTVVPGEPVPSFAPAPGKSAAAAAVPSTGSLPAVSGLTSGGSSGPGAQDVTNGAGANQVETAFLVVGLGLAAAAVEARAVRDL